MLQIKVSYEVLVQLFYVRMSFEVDIEHIVFVKLTHDDPHDAEEVREEEDSCHQLINFQEEANVHNLVTFSKVLYFCLS